MRALASLSIALLVTAAAPRAQAQEPEAEQLLAEGIAARRRGDDESALRAFTRAVALSPTPRARAQRALAEQALGLWLEARAHLDEVLRESAEDPWLARNRDALEEAQATVLTHLGTLEVRTDAEHAELLLEGQAPLALPLVSTIYLLPGPLSLEVRAPGYRAVTRTVRIEAGILARETISLLPEPAAADEPPPRPLETPAAPPTRAATITPPQARESARDASAGDPMRVGAVVLFGVTGAAAALGTVAGVLREVHAAHYNGEACLDGDRSRDENCRAEYDSAVRAEVSSVVLFVAAGASAVSGLVLLLLAPTEVRSTELACGPGPGELGLSCAGTF